MTNKCYIFDIIFLISSLKVVCEDIKTYQLLGDVPVTQQPSVEAVVYSNQPWCADRCFETETCRGFSLASDGYRCVFSLCESNLPIGRIHFSPCVIYAATHENNDFLLPTYAGNWKMYKVAG